MQKAKLLVLITLILGSSFVMLSPVTGQTKKDGQKKSAAEKAPAGQNLFEGSCSACHDGGNNTVEESKTLKKAALKENGFNSVEDVKKRIIEGKGIMPAFADSLKPAEIDAIANYVWEKSQKDWK